MPDVIVIAGPNGAGKSTAAPRILGERLRVAEFVNADVIAAGISAFAPESVAIEAGRIMLRRLDELVDAGKDFAFETTLASRSFAPWIAKLRRDRGYRFHLFYFWLPDPEQSVRRVLERVRLGGHSVPADVIRRRYARGLKNLLTLYAPIADFWALYDNSSTARLVAKREFGGVQEIFDAEAWQMIDRSKDTKQPEVPYQAAPKERGVRGVSIDEITVALREAGRDARRRHKALGHPIVIWRDGKVVVVPPEEIEV